MTFKLRLAWLLLTSAAGAAAVVAVPAKSFAEPLVGYQLQVCESYEVLKNPGDMHAAMMAAWVTPGQLLVERSMPYLVLENTSTKSNGGTGSAELTKFTLTIGDNTKQFDWTKVIKASAGVTVESVNVDEVEGGSAAKKITFNFSGLTPGKKVYFQVDIDPVAKNAFPFDDYRLVLFTLNGGPNNAGNSKTKATFFDDSLDPGYRTVHLPFRTWDNPETNKFTNMGMTFHSNYQMDHVQPYMTGDMGVTPIPEPMAIGLLASGGMGLWLLCGRRKKRRRSARATADLRG